MASNVPPKQWLTLWLTTLNDSPSCLLKTGHGMSRPRKSLLLTHKLIKGNQSWWKYTLDSYFILWWLTQSRLILSGIYLYPTSRLYYPDDKYTDSGFAPMHLVSTRSSSCKPMTISPNYCKIYMASHVIKTTARSILHSFN